MSEPAVAGAASFEPEMAELFRLVSPRYNRANHVLSLGLDFYWRRALVKAMKPLPPGPLLDLAAGTLDVAILLGRAYPSRPVLAADICLPMLRHGLPRLEAARGKGMGAVLPVGGDAFRLPVRTASLAGISLAFGLRNLRPRRAALLEARRALKPGGRLCALEFRGDLKRRPYKFYLNHVLPLLGGLLGGPLAAYRYLAYSILAFPAPEELSAEMRAVGFTVEHKSLSGGLVCLHSAVVAG